MSTSWGGHSGEGSGDETSEGESTPPSDGTRGAASPNPFAAGGSQSGGLGSGYGSQSSYSGGFASPDGQGSGSGPDRAGQDQHPWSPYTSPYTALNPSGSSYPPSSGSPYPGSAGSPYPPPAGTPYPPPAGTPYPSPAYGPTPYPAAGGWPMSTPTSGLAVASLVCGIVGFFVLGVTSIPAAICGHLAWSDTKNGRASGHGMVIAGLILAYIQIVGWIIFWIAFGVSSGS